MKRGRRCAALCAVAVGLVLVPAIDASAAAPGAAREQAQNHRISRVIAATRTLTVKLGNITGDVGNLAGLVATNTQSLSSLQTLAGKLDTRVSAIEALGPQIFDALTKLQSGLTAAGAGLQKLGDAYQAVEYGRAGIFPSGATPTLAAGGTVTSADIPDDGNAITTGENAIVVAGASGAMTIDLRAAIRSNEADGASTSDTAGQAGGYLYVVNLDTGARVACGGGPPNPPGIIGTTPGDPIVTPTGTVTTLPLKNIPGGVPRTDTSKPDGTSTSLLPGPCGFAAAAGTTYQVHYSVNFVDIPTSTTPGPKE